MECVLCIIYTYLKCLQTSFPSLSPTDFFFFFAAFSNCCLQRKRLAAMAKSLLVKSETPQTLQNLVFCS